MESPRFYTALTYGSPVGQQEAQKWHVIAGIADPIPFIDHLQTTGEILSERIFPDHHAFTENEIADLERLAQNLTEGQGIITTHKDFVRLEQFFHRRLC